jgi:SAM-dependent methyltransferase
MKIIDFMIFPLRVFMFERGALGLTSLRDERFGYVSEELHGVKCLDIGCGRYNRFITQYMGGSGEGVDCYPYEGLTERNLVKDLSKLPFKNESFNAVTFIACLNHCPKNKRVAELDEAYRVLVRGGKIIVTMGIPAAEVAIHWLISRYDQVFGTKNDVDTIRGMKEGESHYIPYLEIKELLIYAGFNNIRLKRFQTQWNLNGMVIGEKE